MRLELTAEGHLSTLVNVSYLDVETPHAVLHET